MKTLESKERLTIKELLRIAYEYGNDGADMPADSETVEKEFDEWFKDTGELIRKLNFIIDSSPLTGKRLEILEKTYKRLLSKEPTKL